jgi:MFS family permease
MIIAYFDRVNLSVVLVLKEFKELYHLTDHDRGVLNSAFFLSYAFLQVPAGWWVDRYGAKYPLAAGFFLWSLISAATAVTHSVRQLFMVRVVLGVSEAVVTPAGMGWIRFHFPEEKRGLAVGLYMAAAKVGPALGAPIAAWLVLTSGWRNMFVILGLGALIWLIPWLLMVKDDRPKGPNPAVQKSAHAAIHFGQVMTSPVIWGTVIGTFSYQYFVYFCMTWMPAYFVERRHLSLDSMGLYTMFSFLGMAAVATLAGWVADWIIHRGGDPVRVRKAFTIAGLLLASTEIIGAYSHSSSVALFFAIFSLSGLGLATANYWALTQTLIPGAAVGRIVGVQNCAASLSGVVAPFLTGLLKQATGSYEAPMLAVVVFLVAGIAAYIFLVRQDYAPAMKVQGSY